MHLTFKCTDYTVYPMVSRYPNTGKHCAAITFINFAHVYMAVVHLQGGLERRQQLSEECWVLKQSGG